MLTKVQGPVVQSIVSLTSALEGQRVKRLLCCGSLVILDVARCYLWLFTLYINIKIGKNSY